MGGIDLRTPCSAPILRDDAFLFYFVVFSHDFRSIHASSFRRIDITDLPGINSYRMAMAGLITLGSSDVGVAGVGMNIYLLYELCRLMAILYASILRFKFVTLRLCLHCLVC